MFNEKHFPSGSILAYYRDPHNAPHHTTWFGALIAYAQSFFPDVDPNATHISLIHKVIPGEPQEGFTNLLLFDTLKDQYVAVRYVEHNYAYDIYTLRRDRPIHKSFTPDQLAEKAIEIAKQFLGMPYKRATLLEVIFRPKKPNESYVKDLCERFSISVEDGLLELDTINDGFICSEFVLACYQIAWIMLDARANHGVMPTELPDWLNIHYQSTPAEVAHWLSKNRQFELVPPDCTYELRCSGKPDPRDNKPPEAVVKQWQIRSYHQPVAAPPVEEESLIYDLKKLYTPW